MAGRDGAGQRQEEWIEWVPQIEVEERFRDGERVLVHEEKKRL
jgi:hypothetical protein